MYKTSNNNEFNIQSLNIINLSVYHQSIMINLSLHSRKKKEKGGQNRVSKMEVKNFNNKLVALPNTSLAFHFEGKPLNWSVTFSAISM